MKVIVAGSRKFTDYRLLKRKLDRIFAKLDKKKLVVLSGHAEGADRLGERWCDERLVRYEIHRPDYDKHPGKSAPIVRNAEMVAAADALVCFLLEPPDRLLVQLISLAKAKKLPTRMIQCERST